MGNEKLKLFGCVEISDEKNIKKKYENHIFFYFLINMHANRQMQLETCIFAHFVVIRKC